MRGVCYNCTGTIDYYACYTLKFCFYCVFWLLLETNCLIISGGSEFGDIEDCIVHEEFAYGCSGITTAILANNLGVSKPFDMLSNQLIFLLIDSFLD